ncbi:nitrogen permease regulator 2 [Dacryopinax primogenitus]|uniref:Nitrogen permease regulator 2 n=1 Tax=Dacryopinax primogenitus (strain DJM 731) TaxID=1858805 RepID=M5FRU7_DACPD|nr:nitrogen permease regulator 2 [Dacryopinax primogenitus]EJT97774.1 nitrogen permease regulator 2 [Dacryopinax primogenitus]
MRPTEPDESFLPRIQAVFYAVFDPSKGPKVAYQVPEGLVASRYAPPVPLFDFNDVSEFVIPKTQLCNRLVICTTPTHKIAGFPVLLEHSRYTRNEFRFNCCFVFKRNADLGCLEPVVRKVGRVLTECEQDSLFLSSPLTAGRIYPLLEQLYEDLNSYSESSIPLTPHTTLDLKIFPFYPNPSRVRDWDVPVALVDIRSKLDGSSDVTMVRVVQWVDGVRCVGRIAEEADVDLDWVRGCVEHLLYYQHVMLLDLFSPSNIYMLTPAFKYLAMDPVVTSECPVYVTPPTKTPLPWSTLLRFYNRFKPGKTVAEWADECGVWDEVTLDACRFITFGVIKGFLRRVERYPPRSPSPGVVTPGTTPPAGVGVSFAPPAQVPTELLQLLDGTHSGDELCWMFGVSWEDMEAWLARIGGVPLGGKEEHGRTRADLGRVRIMFR